MRRINSAFLKRKKQVHKGECGHVFVLAGSRGLTGAACLSAQAALLSGAGLVTVGIAASLNNIIECKLTEAMSLSLPETSQASLSLKAFDPIKDFSQDIDVIIIGPGLSQNSQTQKLIRKIIGLISKPMVIDADAINALAGNLNVLAKRTAQTVITPHPGEMGRLLGLDVEKIQKNRRKLAKELSCMYNIVTILKGYQTVVADKDGKIFINKTGNPGLAKGGSGDVLTGIIAGFMAQGASAYNAAELAVYVHGLAADKVVQKKAMVSLLASDILENLPLVLKKLTN
ncbi:MAG: NAD(P)H-hydrate dehydratase [Candidatus Omnitrophica bacterium]|nr:NAD(P)H-hydrate dehydratase [Candidatus Omnitrophota bacterium]